MVYHVPLRAELLTETFLVVIWMFRAELVAVVPGWSASEGGGENRAYCRKVGGGCRADEGAGGRDWVFLVR